MSYRAIGPISQRTDSSSTIHPLPTYHPLPLVLHHIHDLGELLETRADHDLIVRLAVADALELELHEGVGQAAVRPRQLCDKQEIHY